MDDVLWLVKKSIIYVNHSYTFNPACLLLKCLNDIDYRFLKQPEHIVHLWSEHWLVITGEQRDLMTFSTSLKWLREVDRKDIERVFREYDAVRWPRSQKVIDVSSSMSAIASFEGDHTGDDLDSIREDLCRFSWLWYIDMKELVQQAKHMYLGGLEDYL